MIAAPVKTGRSVTGWIRPNPYAWVSVAIGLSYPLRHRDRKPSRRGFFIGRTVRDSNGLVWAADKNTHGAYSHGAYPSRRVRERPHKFKRQW
jgi:hypothetical protein